MPAARRSEPRLAAASLLAAALSGAVFLSCAPEPVRRTEYALGTSCAITLYERGREAAADAAFARLREIEDRMSANKAGTEVDAVNRSAGIAPVKVSADTFRVLRTALEYGRLTDGALDVTIGPLVRLWGIGSGAERVPRESEIEAARALVDYRLVSADEAALTVYLPKKGMSLDLGAVAKGYAADEAVRILGEAGTRRAIVDFGGNIYAMGRKKDGADWRIGIQDPDSPRGGYLGVASIANASLVTSGDYERFFEEGGRRYHHILDAKTGYPSAAGLRSVTVIGAPSIACDALSTAMFALGLERGRLLAKGLPGFSFVFVDEGERVWPIGSRAEDFAIQPGRYSLGRD